ncbi:MAG TPA: PadR family transcriptional regulator [Vicinamibacterales bacterium]
MKTRSAPAPEQLALVQGTLDVLILRILSVGPQHGQGIARAIQETSGNVLLVDHGALYPALQRLEARTWISAAWGTSTHNRRAKFYRLTRTGRKELTGQTHRWRRFAGAMARVLGLGEEPEGARGVLHQRESPGRAPRGGTNRKSASVNVGPVV